jgi:hypothetical protein
MGQNKIANKWPKKGLGLSTVSQARNWGHDEPTKYLFDFYFLFIFQ